MKLEELEQDAEQRWCYRGRSYSGEAKSEGPEGTVDAYFKGGRKHGRQLRLFPDGQVAEDCRFREGVYHGTRTVYFPGGNKRQVLEYEYGIQVSREEYSETGEVIEKEVISEDAPNYELLKAQRNMEIVKTGPNFRGHSPLEKKGLAVILLAFVFKLGVYLLLGVNPSEHYAGNPVHLGFPILIGVGIVIFLQGRSQSYRMYQTAKKEMQDSKSKPEAQ